jgi:hypothetical protein
MIRDNKNNLLFWVIQYIKKSILATRRKGKASPKNATGQKNSGEI